MTDWTNWVKDEKTRAAMDYILNGGRMDEKDAANVLSRMWDESPQHIAKAVGQDFYDKYYPTNRGGPVWKDGKPIGVVDHYTTGVNARGVLRWFSSEPRGPDVGTSSAHVVIDREGVIMFVVNPLTHVAWHAPGANNNHIGIENVNAGLLRKAGDRYYRMRAIPYREDRIPMIQTIKEEYWEPYTCTQVVANILLKRLFFAAIPTIKREHLVDHEMVDPTRKRDCGPLWPLQEINDMAITDVRFRDMEWTKHDLLREPVLELFLDNVKGSLAGDAPLHV